LFRRGSGGGQQPSVTFGQRLQDIYLSGSSEDAPQRKLWGRMRLGGNIIWCSQFLETIVPNVTYPSPSGGGGGGGKGGGQSQPQPNVEFVYHYSISFAVAFCEGGDGVSLGRVWADGKLLDLTQYAWRFYPGDENQEPDSLIESIEGVGNVPAYRGTCYLLFEWIDLAAFGNRTPQITAEIVRVPPSTDSDDLTNCLASVVILPGSGEFVYGTAVYSASDGYGNWVPQNANVNDTRPDFMISLDQLVGDGRQVLSGMSLSDFLGVLGVTSLDEEIGGTGRTLFSLLGATSLDQLLAKQSISGGELTTIFQVLGTLGGISAPLMAGDHTSVAGVLSAPSAVSLVASWFGNDLRAANCHIVPKVETAAKNATPADWMVAGWTRSGIRTFPWGTGPYGTPAEIVSQIDVDALDPGGAGGSVSFGGGTVPAIGGTPSDDTVVQAIQEIKRRGLRCVFYPLLQMDIPGGNTLPDPYGGANQAAYAWRGRITCDPAPGRSGTPDKTATAATQINSFFTRSDGYNAFVLHYANLCVSAGGVDAFIIGSEFVGLTGVRSSAGDGTYPAVQALKSLAASVKAIVGSTCKVGYAADWSEYHSHRPGDGTNDVIFNMDPLWSDSNIDFIGIDNYLPLSDWRDVGTNLDAVGAKSIYDKTYLKANVEGGEYFAWYYGSTSDRAAQTRTPIVDTAHGEHWIFRQKDIRSWWSNAHKSRPGGVQNAGTTSWAAQSKPIWFTEFGCPAVDKGTNQPNVFFDPKSSESFLPYFSRGSKDDAIQRAYLEAMLTYWRDHAPDSTVYSGKMIVPQNMFAWAWDARPFPDFPAKTSVWHDSANYELGHWLTGRVGEIPLKWIVEELCDEVDVAARDTSGLIGPDTLVLGFAAEGVNSPRDMLTGLMVAYQFDALESGGKVVFASRANAIMTAIDADELVLADASDLGFEFTRGQETDLPDSMKISFIDPYADYASGSVEARKAIGSSANTEQSSVPAVLDRTYASSLATSLLQQRWAARESGTLKLPPSRLAIDPGDGISISLDGVNFSLRAQRVQTSTYRQLEVHGFDPTLLSSPAAPQDRRATPGRSVIGAPIIEFLELPLLTGEETRPWAPRIAAYSSPWSGVNVYRSNGTGYDLVGQVTAPSGLGELTGALYPGPVSRWDLANAVYVRLYGSTQLLSLIESQVLAGAGAIAVKNAASGQWEILQFQNAELLGAQTYKLSKLLRGQLGTEGAMANPFPIGSRVLALDTAALAVLQMSIDQRGLAQTLRYGPASKLNSDPNYVEQSFTFAGIGLRPYSVSHIEGNRVLPATDVTFTWVRRTRFAGDSWEPADVPLNEDFEAYDVEVVNGAAIARTVRVDSPTWTYDAASQVADFGSAQSGYTLNVYQISALFGRGQVNQTAVTL
jgi:hypothetical protein